MKNLRKTLAAVIAMAVMSASVSAFAATTQQGTYTPETAANITGTGTYSVANKTLTLTPNADSDTQMTFVIFDADLPDVADWDAPGYDVANDIIYIDQQTAGQSFTGTLNPSRITGAEGDAVPNNGTGQSYKVWVGLERNGEFAIDKGTLTIGAYGIESVAINAPGTLECGTGATLSAVVDAKGGAANTVTWSIQGANTIGATINASTGVIDATSAGTVTVRATSTADDEEYDEITVTFEEPTPDHSLESVYITAAPAATGTVGDTITLTANISDSELEGTPGLEYAWTKVSGTGTVTGNGKTATVTAEAAGTTRVNVSVTLNGGTPVTNVEPFSVVFNAAAPTITVKWGDVDLDNTADTTDMLAILYGYAGRTESWSKAGYTFTYGSSDVTANDKTYTLNINGSAVKWGDVDLDNTADTTDMLAVLYGYAGRTESWSKAGETFGYNTNKTLTLTEKAE